MVYEAPDEFEILPGNSHPLGPTVYEEGVNFSLFSKHGKSVDILLFNSVEDIHPSQVIHLDPKVHRTYYLSLIHI